MENPVIIIHYKNEWTTQRNNNGVYEKIVAVGFYTWLEIVSSLFCLILDFFTTIVSCKREISIDNDGCLEFIYIIISKVVNIS